LLESFKSYKKTGIKYQGKKINDSSEGTAVAAEN